MPKSKRPDFSKPKGEPTSELLAKELPDAIPMPPGTEGMRRLTPEEEADAIPVPMRKAAVKREIPVWLPRELDLTALPEGMEDYVHPDLRSAIEESPLQTEGLDEVLREIEREQSAGAPAPKHSSFVQVTPTPTTPVTPAPVIPQQQAYTMPTTPVSPVSPIATPTPPVFAAGARPAPQRSAVPVATKPTVKRHPVFDSLLRDFGIAQELKFEVYKGHKFTFRQYNAEQNTFCISLADTLSTSALEYNERIRQNLVAVSLVAIDDNPIYEVLGYDPREAGFVLQDPFNFPSKLSMLLVEHIRKLFLEQFAPAVIMDLWSIYDSLFPASSIKDPAASSEEVWRFKCPVNGCTHSVDAVPEFDSQGLPRKYFCPEHGNELSIMGQVADLENVPLA